MATRKIPIKFTVTTRATVQRRVQLRSRTHSSARTSFSSWQGPLMPNEITNYYGDHNTIAGDGNMVAIGVQGSVVQITGPPPVNPHEIAGASRQLLAVLDQIPLDADDVEQLRADAETVVAEAAADQPDQEELRSRGKSMAEVLGKVGTAATGGVIAQLVGRAIMTSMGM